MASYTNFCCRAGGSNLNAGTRTGSTTEPAVTPDFEYLSGTWVSATRTFTVASGNPLTDGVAVGDYVSVYADGASATGYVAQVSSVTSTTIVTHATKLAGSVPSDGTNNRTLRVGGAWLGPNGANPWIDTFPGSIAINVAGDPICLNLKNDQTYTISAAMTLGTNDVAYISGYSSAYHDNGITTINGGSTGASYILLTVGGTASPTHFKDLEFVNNGSTGSANALSFANTSTRLTNVKIHDVRGAGITTSATSLIINESKIYNCNQSNTSNLAGIIGTGGLILNRTSIHNNTGTNTAGIRLTGSTGIALRNSLIYDNGTLGGVVLTSVSVSLDVNNCDFYNNVGPGASVVAGTSRFENTNFFKSGTYGISTSSTGIASLFNCRFGTGTMANTLGNTSGNVEEVNSINYTANVTPWADPTTGDYNLTDTELGRGVFLDNTTVANLQIGAGQTAVTGSTTNILITRPRKVM